MVRSDKETTAGGQERSKALALGLAAALLVAGGLRFYSLGEKDYWFDELHSLSNSAGLRADFEAVPHGVVLTAPPRTTRLTPESTIGRTWRRMVVDSHPPMYFVLLLEWRRLFGDGEFAVRALSVLFSVLSLIPVAMMLGVYGRRHRGLWLAGVLCVAYGHIHIAQEARPYSLGLLFVSLSYWAFVNIEHGWNRLGRRDKCVWAIVYGASMYLAVLTHYFTVLALLGQVVVVALRMRGPSLRAWAGIVAVAVAAFLLTWGRQVFAQMDFIMSQDWLLEDKPDHVLRTFHRLSDLPVRLLFAHERFQLNYMFSLVGAMLVIGTLLALRRRRSGEAVVYAAWYLVPVLTFLVLDLLTGKQLLNHIRYSSMALPGLAGMLVLMVDPLRPSRKWAATIGFGLAVALTIELPTQVNPRNRRAAALIAEQLRPGDLLVFDAMDWPPFWTLRIFQNVTYYLPAYLHIAPPPCVLIREPPDESLKGDMGDFDRIIVVAPRVDVTPNPLPDQYKLFDETGYVDKVGFIYLFVRTSG
ncbi:MAG: glycosyltransferase family 39 protein [Phycisphaerae bacterium]|jgi:uncharacterized membrane protein